MPQAAINALIGLTLMLAVAGAYYLMARRARWLWHPLAIVAAVTVVSVVVSVAGELASHDGGTGVSGMLRRSALGGLGWGVIIALVVWGARRLSVSRRAGRQHRA